jgi:hypothetical protein
MTASCQPDDSLAWPGMTLTGRKPSPCCVAANVRLDHSYRPKPPFRFRPASATRQAGLNVREGSRPAVRGKRAGYCCFGWIPDIRPVVSPAKSPQIAGCFCRGIQLFRTKPSAQKTSRIFVAQIWCEIRQPGPHRQFGMRLPDCAHGPGFTITLPTVPSAPTTKFSRVYWPRSR